MRDRLFSLQAYEDLMKEHICDMIDILLDNNIEFRVLSHKSKLDFQPPLPSRVTDTMGDMVLFDISNYSFESAELNEEIFCFGAGFGSENMGATVCIPLSSIAQIFIGEVPILLNFTPLDRPRMNDNQSNMSPKNSMEALLNNPNNQHLLQKRKR